MAIIINIDVMLAKRKMSVTELAEKVGITMANLSILKNDKRIKPERVLIDHCEEHTIRVARDNGFDGWFVNQETAGGDTALATAMKEFLTYLRASGLRVIWYDAMTRTGSGSAYCPTTSNPSPSTSASSSRAMAPTRGRSRST